MAQEEKHNNKKLIELVSDGLAWLLSGDEFYELMRKEKEMCGAMREMERKKDGRASY